MANSIYTVYLDFSNELINDLSAIDRFDGAWSAIERREGSQTLKELKSVATVNSVGASTRIEGSAMTNDEVRMLIFENLKIEKLTERDQQEVAGYFNTMDVISESFPDIAVSEGSISTLHNLVMKFSGKDQWHKGKYKQHTNVVEATNADGTKTILFQTAAPGFETDDAMRSLIEWFNADTSTPAVIKAAIFVYDFLSIHPFQDGNGRLSRLLSTLLLLKSGYTWIQYVSFEHEIESRKAEYYKVLMECQQKRPGENVTPWLSFFLNCLRNIQIKLLQKLEQHKDETQMSPRKKMVYTFINNHPGCGSAEIAEKLKLSLPTVKKTLAEMVNSRWITKQGTGKATHYSTEKLSAPGSGLALTLTEKEPVHTFSLKSRYDFLQINKIILAPQFEWTQPDEWADKLLKQGLYLVITCAVEGRELKQKYFIRSFVNAMQRSPEFKLSPPISISAGIWRDRLKDDEFPVVVKFEMQYSVKPGQFEMVLIYDTSLME